MVEEDAILFLQLDDKAYQHIRMYCDIVKSDFDLRASSSRYVFRANFSLAKAIDETLLRNRPKIRSIVSRYLHEDNYRLKEPKCEDYKTGDPMSK